MIVDKRKFWLFLICVLIWMIVIFRFSSEKSDQSDETSLNVGKVIAEIMVNDFDKMSEEEQFEMIEGWNFAIRKTAHFCEYAILGILVILMLLQIDISRKNAMIFGILICAFYAMSDELHQYFVPGRACQFRDVCIDTAGAATGIFILLILVKGYERLLKNRVAQMGNRS